MLVLGWHGGWRESADAKAIDGPEDFGHDASAVLLKDGEIVAAIEEERLSRIKHTHSFPEKAIRFCLKEGNVTLADLDVIAMDTSEQFLDSWVTRKELSEFGGPPPTGRDHVAAIFRTEFGVDVRNKLFFCSHHLAHMHACWRTSGLREPLAVCLDAQGDFHAGAIAQCSEAGIKPLRHIRIQQSLGRLYLDCIAILGYHYFDEYKVMGLAPYGDPAVYRRVLSRMYQLLPEGQYSLATGPERLAYFTEAGLLQVARRRGEPLGQAHRDFAASLQEALECIVIHVLEHFRKATGTDTLCLTGGVAHNCSMNGRLLRSKLFRQIYVQPAAHDGGNSLGAALSAVNEIRDTATWQPMTHVYLGGNIGGDDTVGRQLDRWSPLIVARQLIETCRETARLIADGAVVAWVQGRSEFGPRALGNRSILADPRPSDNKRRINEMVKKRESYRPFAPSVLQHRLHEFFDVPEHAESFPYMTFAVPVRKDKRELLGAVTHVDGTARVQTVTERENPRYFQLIKEFEVLTGVGILLNTSFNNNVEPIVESVDDAVATFLCTSLDYLVIGDWLVHKPGIPSGHAGFLKLVPRVAEGWRLVVNEFQDAGYAAFLEFIPHFSTSRTRTPISATLMNVLLDLERESSWELRCRKRGVDPAELVAEVFHVWQRRSIVLRPGKR